MQDRVAAAGKLAVLLRPAGAALTAAQRDELFPTLYFNLVDDAQPVPLRPSSYLLAGEGRELIQAAGRSLSWRTSL